MTRSWTSAPGDLFLQLTPGAKIIKVLSIWLVGRILREKMTDATTTRCFF
jgi:hypothetical protein